MDRLLTVDTVDVTLLLNALAGHDTVFVLGAGASAPDIPTVSQLPGRFAPFAKQLSSFPAGPLPDSPLRRLIGPLIEEAKQATTMEQVWPGMMTAGTVAVLIEDMISCAHSKRFAQYEVFGLFSTTACVISFNWDGLATARCTQQVVLHPHGFLPPRTISPSGLSELLDFSLGDAFGRSREWLLPGLVMPGEEEDPEHAEMRERVFQLWLGARAVVVIGYTFGLGSTLSYDRAWLDAFVAAMRDNPNASIHIVDPEASSLRELLCEQVGRGMNVHAWALKWNVLSAAMLEQARAANAPSIIALAADGSRILQRYADKTRLP